jgi:hypothetical protein
LISLTQAGCFDDFVGEEEEPEEGEETHPVIRMSRMKIPETIDLFMLYLA